MNSEQILILGVVGILGIPIVTYHIIEYFNRYTHEDDRFQRTIVWYEDPEPEEPKPGGGKKIKKKSRKLKR